MVAKSAIYVAALAAAARSVVGHTIVTSVWVNGKDTADAGVGQGSSYMRTPSSNSPVKVLTSTDLRCNDKGATAVSGYLTVAPGDTIEPEWYHSGGRGDDALATSHVGPLTTWIAPLDTNGDGEVWVQIASEAYYSSSNEWATDKMIANKGRNTVTVPLTLAPGDYLVRFDALGLHEAQSAGGAQFYPNCAQITVTGSGTQELPAGVAIPGFYTADTPGVVWDVYYSATGDVHTDYVAPGTGVWDGSASYSTETCTETVDGLAPAGYCQGGASSKPVTTSKASATTPRTTVTTSKARTTTKAPVASSSAIVTTSAAVQPSSSKAASTTSRAASSVTAGQPSATSTAAATTTSSAADSTYTDYNSCMRAYNKCLDEHQPKHGGAADFSECYSTFQCSNSRMKRSARPAKRHGKNRVVRRSH
ncbi:hypothetical protein JCM11251_004764 [Rhodosporidiobolus azoricus]